MHNIRYSPEARDDFKEILDYISDELDSPAAAKRTVRQIRERIRSLSRFPNSGEALDGYVSVKTGYRRLVCGNYLAFYQVEPRAVNIIRILHGSRNYIKILFGDYSAEESAVYLKLKEAELEAKSGTNRFSHEEVMERLTAIADAPDEG